MASVGRGATDSDGAHKRLNEGSDIDMIPKSYQGNALHLLKFLKQVSEVS